MSTGSLLGTVVLYTVPAKRSNWLDARPRRSPQSPDDAAAPVSHGRNYLLANFFARSNMARASGSF